MAQPAASAAAPITRALTALAVIACFIERPDRYLWRTMLAPAIGVAGSCVAIVLMIENFNALTGTTSTLINSLPW